MEPIIKGAVTAFMEHAQAFAALLADRYTEGLPSGWSGYKFGDELEGMLTGTDTVKFWRPDHPEAYIMFGFINIPNFEAIDRSEPVTLNKTIESANVDKVLLAKGATLHRTYSHTFQKSTSETEAWKRHWGVAVELNIGYTPAYETGGINFNAKFGADFSIDDSTSSTDTETTTDTIEATFDIVGPFHGHIQAERSREQQQRTATISPNLDSKVYYGTGNANAEWYPMSILVRALKGETPKHTDYTHFAGSTNIRQIMLDNPLTDEELEILTHRRTHKIEVTYKYDDVSAGSLVAVRDKKKRP